jgi:hypothetical protein
MKKVPTLMGSSETAAEILEEVEAAQVEDAETDLEAPEPAEPGRAKRDTPRVSRPETSGAGFVADNALALTLMGLGASWLAFAASRPRRDLVAEFPLTTGALAVATGVGIALALPETQLESRAIKPLARGLAEQARGLVGHARADIRTAREAVGGLRDVLSKVT